MNWTTNRIKNVGTVYSAANGRVRIERRTWRKPGFKSQNSSGWVILVDGEQWGAAHKTAEVAKGHLAQAGVATMLARRLAGDA